MKTKHPQLHIESKIYKMMQGGGKQIIFLLQRFSWFYVFDLSTTWKYLNVKISFDIQGEGGKGGRIGEERCRVSVPNPWLPNLMITAKMLQCCPWSQIIKIWKPREMWNKVWSSLSVYWLTFVSHGSVKDGNNCSGTFNLTCLL